MKQAEPEPQHRHIIFRQGKDFGVAKVKIFDPEGGSTQIGFAETEHRAQQLAGTANQIAEGGGGIHNAEAFIHVSAAVDAYMQNVKRDNPNIDTLTLRKNMIFAMIGKARSEITKATTPDAEKLAALIHRGQRDG